MIWAFYALLHSLFRALMIETGRHIPCADRVRALLQAVFGLLLLVPFWSIMRWPQEQAFYFAAASVGIILAVGILIQTGLSEMRAGRTASLAMPIETLAAFGIWLAISPSGLRTLTANPLSLLALGLGFASAFIALWIIRPNDMTRHNVLIVVPVSLSVAVAGVVTKIVLPAAADFGVILPYVAVNLAAMAAILGPAALIKREDMKAAVTFEAFRGGIAGGALAAGSFVCFALAVALSANPGYVCFIAMLLPVWIIGLHKFARAEEKASPVAAFLLVLAALILIVAAAQEF